MEIRSQRVGHELPKKNSQEVRLMNEAIGNAAGMIWKFLDQQPEPVNLSNLKKSLELPSTPLMMGLGWLAKEDKLVIETSGNSPSYRICLKH